jgi:glycosyltransferase involved in cell wall biosynthesis
VRRAVDRLLQQTLVPAEVLVVDDGSDDGSAETLRGLPVRVIRHERNLGRGAARARAMREAAHELVVCCDATNVLEPAFVERARPWFDDARVAAVHGRITQEAGQTVAERWRGRHLFKGDTPQEVRRGASLATYGAIVRASAARIAGGFDPRRRHSEDSDMGGRLSAAGLEVIYDPRLTVTSVASNSVGDVLERYWRWYAGQDEATSWRGYWKNIGYSVTGMAAADLRARDPLSAGVSLLAPHYQYWRSRSAARRR